MIHDPSHHFDIDLARLKSINRQQGIYISETESALSFLSDRISPLLHSLESSAALQERLTKDHHTKKLSSMPSLTDLLIWNDSVAHTGEENMAIDELLLKGISSLPLLRIYRWSMPSVSFGYFESLEAARASFPANDQPLSYIRRWTGGGIVDHRIDLTYTLIIPKSHPMASLRGAESYRIIHQAVAAALNDQAVACRLTPTDTGDGAAACFANPVAYDIITTDGSKLAGAGQKRSRYGLLHQGSVIGISDHTQWQKDFIKHLAENSHTWQPAPELLIAARQLGIQKYATEAWLMKR